MTESESIAEHRVWRRVHRPEEYVQDMIRFIAGEMKLPAGMLLALTPIARAMVRRWEDAAVEYTEFMVYADGGRMLRTIFLIHNYSDSAVYALMEKVLKSLGVCRTAMLDECDVDFSWRLLGGVLTDYASKAGVSRETTGSLLTFRLRNSDYSTITTWRKAGVEIFNLKTGRRESLDLPAGDVNRIVDWALGFHKKGKQRYRNVTPLDAEDVEFRSLMCRYDALTQTSDTVAGGA